MKRLRHVFVWLSRIHRCRGFGIQSPTDYWFVRYVVNEHWPYYQYDELAVAEKNDWLSRKLGQLCFRLANWRQPTCFACIPESEGPMRWIKAGCWRTRLATDQERAGLIWIGQPEDFTHIYNKVDEKTVAVVNGIHRDKAAIQKWQQIKDDGLTGITFDLYYCGIVMFDKKRTKQHYVVNF